MRSCRRNGRSCQNSISSGVMRKPDQYGGRGNVADRYSPLDARPPSPAQSGSPAGATAARPRRRCGCRGPRGEIGIGLGRRRCGDGPAHAHLPAQALPMEDERRLAARRELAALGALEVGVEHEAAAGALPGRRPSAAPCARWAARRIDGRQRHGVGIVRLVARGFREPGSNSANGSPARRNRRARLLSQLWRRGQCSRQFLINRGFWCALGTPV